MSADDATRSFPRTVVLVSGAVLAWAADFLFIYVFAAVSCARGFDMTVAGYDAVIVASVGATLVALAVTLALLGFARRRLRRDAEAFEPRMSLTIGLLAAIAIVFTGVPVWLVGSCT